MASYSETFPTSLTWEVTFDEMLREKQDLFVRKVSYTSKQDLNKIVLFYQPHFFEKENELWQQEIIKQKIVENRKKYLGKAAPSSRELLRGFKISGVHRGFSHFSPLWFKKFLDSYSVKCVYDPCGGWGHRLLGATSVNYIYNDLDLRSVEGVKKIASFIRKKDVLFFNHPAESFTPSQEYDAVFLSPPYWDKEKYLIKGSASEFSYPEWEQWLSKVVDISFKFKKSAKYLALVLPESCEKLIQRLTPDLVFLEKASLGPISRNFLSREVKGSWRDYIFVFSKHSLALTSEIG